MKRCTAIQVAAVALFLTVRQAGVICAQEGGSHEESTLDEDKDEIAVEEGKPLSDYLPFDVHGFWELRGGLRTREDPRQSKDATLGETRLQLELSKALDWSQLRLKSDFLYDAILEEALVDLREANALFTPLDFMDVKFGRQVLTWGTGDYIFINDLFPKDWESFLIGRDDEYLKAPSDAIKTSLYMDLFNLDFVYTPRFNPDRFVDGERLSYFNPQLGRLAGEDVRVRTRDRNEWFHDSETALRLSRYVGGYDLALYSYRGFWKSPLGFDPDRGKATFPRLSAHGASARGRLLGGIGNIEVGYYDSRDDRGGSDPFVPNSQVRVLAGYEQEVATDFIVGAQYYVEHMLDYGAYRRSLPSGSHAADENQHLLTLRLTRLAMHQNLKLSLFTFYSPSDQDAYLRPNVHYRVSDHWSVEGGANIFFGRERHTFFGQFEDNSSVYFGMRYSF